MSRWIGLTGPMGAGKDFAFKTMSHIGGLVYRVSFADVLRNEIVQELGMPIFPPKPYSPTVRRLLQWWGTDLRRSEDENYWVNKTEAQVLRMPGGLTPVFTDVRFPNEADMVVRNGGLLVRVMAGAPIREMRLGMAPPQHESETALDNYDWPDDVYHLHSAGDTPQYRRAVEMLLRAAEIPHG